jgi:hypothetical protein
MLCWTELQSSLASWFLQPLASESCSYACHWKTKKVHPIWSSLYFCILWQRQKLCMYVIRCTKFKPNAMRWEGINIWNVTAFRHLHYFLLDWYFCGLEASSSNTLTVNTMCVLYRSSRASPSVTPLDATSRDQSPEKKTLPNLPFLIDLSTHQ